MMILIHAGQVMDDGRTAATFFWPEELGKMPVPCVIEMEGRYPHEQVKDFIKAALSPKRDTGEEK